MHGAAQTANAPLGIETPQHRAAIAPDRRELDGDAVPLARVLAQRAEHVGAIERAALQHFLRRSLQLREKIHVVLDDVRHFLRRQMRGIHAQEVDLAGERTGRIDRFAIGVVQRHDRARGGRVLGELAQIVGGQRVVLEQRIAEDFLQIRGEAGRVVIGERAEVRVQHLGDTEEQVGRQRPLIVLDEIEVARRDLELRCEV